MQEEGRQDLIDIKEMLSYFSRQGLMWGHKRNVHKLAMVSGVPDIIKGN